MLPPPASLSTDQIDTATPKANDGAPRPVAAANDGDRISVEELRALQAPVKARYKEEPSAGRVTLRARGGFSVKQTDFGIKPFKGGPAGTVRVADRVTFSFDAIGVRMPVP